MKKSPFLHILIIIAFLANTIIALPLGKANEVVPAFYLPAPGVMVALSAEFNPTILKGIKVYRDNPFRFDFILDQGDGNKRHPEPPIKTFGGKLREGSLKEQLKTESTKLIKYFLASLTIPENDLWVNLSPYEKNRIIPRSFGQTEMGRDLLAEDYMLKQITASLIYPEGQTGKKFWKRIYEEAAKKYGTTDVPVNTFNKVWIVPQKAVVYENVKAGTAYVVESKLKVMLEEDYLSLAKHKGIQKNDVNVLGNKIVREIIIPELTREVNEGKNFAQLRQVYNSLILATWYKKKIRDSILEQVYADKNKVNGVEYNKSIINTRQSGKSDDVELIYYRYLQAFRKGVFNYIKEEPAFFSLRQDSISRKYFSGGAVMGSTSRILKVLDKAMLGDNGMKQVMGGISKYKKLLILKIGIVERSGNKDQAMKSKNIIIKPGSLGKIDLTKSADLNAANLVEDLKKQIPSGKEIQRRLTRFYFKLNWANSDIVSVDPEILAFFTQDNRDFREKSEFDNDVINRAIVMITLKIDRKLQKSVFGRSAKLLKKNKKIMKKNKTKDSAQLNNFKRGGIDLTSLNMNWRTEAGIKFHLDPVMIAALQNTSGFEPVVISLTPLKDLNSFMDSIVNQI